MCCSHFPDGRAGPAGAPRMCSVRRCNAYLFPFLRLRASGCGGLFCIGSAAACALCARHPAPLPDRDLCSHTQG